MIKRLYNWVLSWSESKWGWVALLFIALFEASWFPLPPDILLIALCLGATKKSFRFATICLIGSIIGAGLGYFIGHFLWITPSGDPTALASLFYEYIFSIEKFQNVGALYDRFNFWIVFTAGFTPLPFKLFTIAGGMFDINFVMFIIASIVSRGLRFFLIAGLIWKFGAPIKSFIDKYFNLLATLFAVMLIGFTALGLWIFGSGEVTEGSEVNNEQVEAVELNENSNTEQCDTLDL
ncbi:MAG: DedA family protein [Alistipes sp.]|nr:DedA family protein [Alistipes sp.]